MSYVVCVKWIAKEGEEGAVGAAIEELAKASRVEPGVSHYLAHRDPEDPRAYFIYENYVDEAACKAHVETDHFKRHGVEGAFPLLADKRREIYETID